MRTTAGLFTLLACAAVAQELDPTQFVTAQSPVPFATAKLEVGWSARQKLDASGQVMFTRWAVVGETGDSWLIEHENPATGAMAKGFVMGLTVNKANGKVTQAVLGRPGEEGRPIKINATPPHAPPKPATPTEEDVTLALGTFPAKKYENRFPGADGKEVTLTTWVGRSGELDQVLLKSAGAGQDYELKQLPEESQVTVGEIPVSLIRYGYTNDMVLVAATSSPVLAAFFPYGDEVGKGLFKLVTESATVEIDELGTAAKPQLKW